MGALATEPLLGYAVLALVALQRLTELVVDARHVARLVARGGVVVQGAGTSGMIAFHVAWFAAVGAERLFLGARMPSSGVVLSLALALVPIVAARVWVLTTLKGRWTIRVVVVPGEVPVVRGPYRFAKHPNYAVVVAEVAIVPLLVGAWRTSIVGSLLHVPVLVHRIRREERAWMEIAGTDLSRAHR